MKSNLLLDFEVDKKNNSINIKREFAAKLELVWDAWTKAELLDQWFGPKPCRAETKSMDFSEGGHWLYAIICPESEKQLGKTDYHTINHLKNFTASDSFCDENENTIEDYPVSSWKIEFSEEAGTTRIEVKTKYKSLADLEKMIGWGFTDGFALAMQNLDELLLNQQK